MPITFANPYRGTGLALDAPMPCDDASGVAALLHRCPAHAETPLLALPAVAKAAGVTEVYAKDERERMGLGSFKALGAAHAIAREAAAAGGDIATALSGRTYVTASAGNHGLSVAAGAALFGAQAVVYLSKTVPAAFAERLKDKGARVVIEGDDYEASMTAAAQAAKENGWTLLSDSSWLGYMDLPYRVMEGYLMLAEETVAQMPAPPTHILLQAGVGGLAAAAAALFRAKWAELPHIIVVEPDAAPALVESVKHCRVVDTTGPVSAMGRLDCKTPSMIALNGLSRDADTFATITEDEAAQGITALATMGVATSPSGGAGLAALLAGLEIGPDARVLAILSEGPADD